MGTFEMTIVMLATIESNCPTHINKTYDDDVVTILTNYIENEMEMMTDCGQTDTFHVNKTRLILEKYKQAQLEVTLSIQVAAKDYNEMSTIAKQTVSNLKNEVYRLNDFLLYNDEEDEIYHCQIANIKQVSVPIEMIFELEVAV